MANSELFSTRNSTTPAGVVTRNEAGGQAFQFPACHALAQYATTGCFGQTFYATAEDQLNEVLKYAIHPDVSEEFLAKTAIYARERGCMKDMPALLCAVLAAKRSPLLEKIFPRVIDSLKMLRNFVQILRSGVTGRKSFGTTVRRLIRQWLEARTEVQLFNGSIGNNPSLADVIKMVHPHPATPQREAMYAYLIGKELTAGQKELLPPTVRQFEAFKAGETTEVPDVPFQFLTALELTKEQWTEIARNASWQTTRMNLNTFARHEVFQELSAAVIADRLRDPEEIRRAKAFPYQLMAAYVNANSEIPFEIKESLQDAMELATENVPVIPGSVAVCVDVSGSMSSSVSGGRRGATSRVRCVDVAGLMASCILRKNPRAVIVPFELKVRSIRMNPRDSVLTNAQLLASMCGGGTNCSVALQYLLEKKEYPDVVIYVSDCESWLDSARRGTTATLERWNELKEHNPAAKLINIDVQPYGTTQAIDRDDIANVGGFSDAVFDFVAQFVSGTDTSHWTDLIAAVEI